MAMRVEGNGGNTTSKNRCLIDVPGIKSGIRGDMRGKKAQVSHGLDVQRDKGGDVVLIEGLAILSEDNITVVRGGGTCMVESIATELLFLFVGDDISLLYIGCAFITRSLI